MCIEWMFLQLFVQDCNVHYMELECLVQQPYLQQHRLLRRYDLGGAVVVKVDNLLQQESVPVKLVCCVNLCQDFPVDREASGLQLPDLQLPQCTGRSNVHTAGAQMHHWSSKHHGVT